MQTYTLDQLNELPTSYGIYYFLDDQDNIMYIGKSLNLRKRVKSYFYSREHHPKIMRMLTFVAKIQVQTTDTHLEAKLLEYEEISNKQPNYNRQFKRDRPLMELCFKSNAYKFITWQYNDQQLSLEEKIVLPKARSLYSFADELYYFLPLEKESNIYNFQRRIFPMKLSKIEKQEQIKMLLEILTNEEEFINFQTSLQNQMLDLSQNLEFERAAKFRDLEQHLNYLKRWLFDIPKLFQEEKIYTLESINGQKQVFIKDLVLYENINPPLPITNLDSHDKIQIVYSELTGINNEDDNIEGEL